MNTLPQENSLNICLEFNKKQNPNVILTPDDMRVIREVLKACKDPVTREYYCPEEQKIVTLEEEECGPYFDTSKVPNMMDNLFQKYPNVCDIMTVIVSFQKDMDGNQMDCIISIMEKLPKDIFNNLKVTYSSGNYCIMCYEDYLIEYFEKQK